MADERVGNPRRFALLVVALFAFVLIAVVLLAFRLQNGAATSGAPDADLNTEASAPAASSDAPSQTAGALPTPVNRARPDPVLTPGDVLPVTAAEICVSGYSRKVRNVSTKVKDQVYASYGIKTHAAGEYEVDHLISLELGGSNDIKNLWPEPAEPRPGFHEKDTLENRLHRLVCDGSLQLAVAQQAIASDWWAAYQLYVVR